MTRRKSLAVPSRVTPPVLDPVEFFGQAGDVKPTTWLEAAPKMLRSCDGRNVGVKQAPGLFWYEGFGYGTLYLPNGTTVWCGTTKAAEYCRLTGLTFNNVDPLKCYSGTYLGD